MGKIAEALRRADEGIQQKFPRPNSRTSQLTELVTDLSLPLTTKELKTIKIPDEYLFQFSMDFVSPDRRAYACLYSDGRVDEHRLAGFSLYSKDRAAHGNDFAGVEQTIVQNTGSIPYDFYEFEDGLKMHSTLKIPKPLTKTEIAELIERLKTRFTHQQQSRFYFSSVPKPIYDSLGIKAETSFRRHF